MTVDEKRALDEAQELVVKASRSVGPVGDDIRAAMVEFAASPIPRSPRAASFVSSLSASVTAGQEARQRQRQQKEESPPRRT